MALTPLLTLLHSKLFLWVLSMVLYYEQLWYGEEGGSQAQDHKQFFVSQEMMERALMKQRAGIVQKQVAAGREFKVSS